MEVTYNDFNVYELATVIESECASILFQNNGINTIVTINNSYILQPGQSIDLSCNYGEIDTTKYSFFFSSYGAGSVNKLTVIRRKYKDNTQKKKVYFNFILKQENGYIDSNCGDICFQNYSQFYSPVYINDIFILYAYQNISLNTNECEIDTTKYKFSFQTQQYDLKYLTIIKKEYK
jgi:hypothetical protein